LLPTLSESTLAMLRAFELWQRSGARERAPPAMPRVIAAEEPTIAYVPGGTVAGHLKTLSLPLEH